MKRKTKYILTGTLLFLSLSYLVSCSTTDNPVTANNNASDYTVTVRVDPPEFLRTEETRDAWKNPVEVSYTVDSQGNLSKVAHEDSANDVWEIGSRHAGGMNIVLGYGGGRNMYSMHGNGGMMDVQHPDSGAHHYRVQIFNDSTFSGGHFGMPIPVSEVTVQAISNSDTFTYQLEPVMGEHGYRYEANTALPYGTYNLRLQVNPPDFYRTEATQNFWTGTEELTFDSFTLDSTTAPTEIGTRTVVSGDNDSLEFALSSETPAEFGAMGMQWNPLSGDETVRIALEITDPSNQIAQMPLYDTPVQLTVQNNQTGENETKTLEPIYGPHGLYYGENFMTEMMGNNMHGPGGGHGNGNGGMGMGSM